MAKRPQNRKYRRRRNPRKKAPAKLSTPMIKAVQKLIHKDVETKMAYHALTTTSYNSAIDANTDTSKCIPAIAQGTGDNSRIGDQIRAQSCVIKGAIVYNPSTGQYGTYANSRLGVRLMVVQPKQYANIDNVQNNASTWLTYLLKKGGSPVGFNGNLSDLWAPINSDAITKYYDKVFYLDAPYQATAVGSTTMGRSTKIFKIPLKLRNKLIKYDNSVSSGQYPTNYAPVVVLGYVHMDGSSPDTLTTAVQMTYDSIFTYEDA